jgi:hypothetical protein
MKKLLTISLVVLALMPAVAHAQTPKQVFDPHKISEMLKSQDQQPAAGAFDDLIPNEAAPTDWQAEVERVQAQKAADEARRSVNRQAEQMQNLWMILGGFVVLLSLLIGLAVGGFAGFLGSLCYYAAGVLCLGGMLANPMGALAGFLVSTAFYAGWLRMLALGR